MSSGNHSPLPMIVSVTHQSLEQGMVGLIMFQEVFGHLLCHLPRAWGEFCPQSTSDALLSQLCRG